MAWRSYNERCERFKEIIQRLPANCGIDRTSLLANVGRATDDETKVLDTVLSFISIQPYIGELFRGGHFSLRDGGHYYDSWRRARSARERPSSHKSDRQAFEIAGPLCHTILVGSLGNRTWFQLENHAYYGSTVGHGVDFYKYWRSSRNQGPYGSSPRTDSNPIWIPPDRDDD